MGRGGKRIENLASKIGLASDLPFCYRRGMAPFRHRMICLILSSTKLSYLDLHRFSCVDQSLTNTCYFVWIFVICLAYRRSSTIIVQYILLQYDQNIFLVLAFCTGDVNQKDDQRSSVIWATGKWNIRCSSLGWTLVSLRKPFDSIDILYSEIPILYKWNRK